MSATPLETLLHDLKLWHYDVIQHGTKYTVYRLGEEQFTFTARYTNQQIRAIHAAAAEQTGNRLNAGAGKRANRRKHNTVTINRAVAAMEDADIARQISERRTEAELWRAVNRRRRELSFYENLMRV